LTGACACVSGFSLGCCGSPTPCDSELAPIFEAGAEERISPSSSADPEGGWTVDEEAIRLILVAEEDLQRITEEIIRLYLDPLYTATWYIQK
jgi:hypothetical protein